MAVEHGDARDAGHGGVQRELHDVYILHHQRQEKIENIARSVWTAARLSLTSMLSRHPCMLELATLMPGAEYTAESLVVMGSLSRCAMVSTNAAQKQE